MLGHAHQLRVMVVPHMGFPLIDVRVPVLLLLCELILVHGRWHLELGYASKSIALNPATYYPTNYELRVIVSPQHEM